MGIPKTLTRAEAEKMLRGIHALSEAHIRVVLDRARAPRRDTPLDILPPENRKAAELIRAIVAAHAAHLDTNLEGRA